jgi:hypothetical protein
MSGPSPPDADPEPAADVDPTAAFELLADPTRFAILAAIAESSEDEYRGTLSFSELRERAGVADSGQFNYHLDRLVGPFVRRTDGGYGLRHAGRIAYRLAVSGLLADHDAVDVAALDAPCHVCGGRLAATYEGDRLRVGCRDCDRRVAVGPFPPRALTAHPPAALLRAVDRYLAGITIRAAANVCPWCGSPMAASLDPAGEDWPGVEVVVDNRCDRCHGFVVTRVHDLIRYHPAVVAFCYEHGVDAVQSTVWDLERELAGLTVARDGDDAWAARATLTLEGDVLELGLPASARVGEIAVLEE